MTMNAWPSRPGDFRRLLRILLLATLLGAGFWARSLSPIKVAPVFAGKWPWRTTTMVTLYFSDGPFLFPVSRRLPTSNEVPRAVLQALLTGPSASSGLTNPIPRGVEIRSFKLAGGVAQVDLSAAVLAGYGGANSAESAIVETMTALPGVTSVLLSVEGESLGESRRRVPLLYYAAANGLVAVPVSAITPRAALTMYLSGSHDPELT